MRVGKSILNLIKNFLMLQTSTANNAASNQSKSVYSYDTAFHHHEKNKKFYTISYVHNRDVIPGGMVKQAKKIKHTII